VQAKKTVAADGVTELFYVDGDDEVATAETQVKKDGHTFVQWRDANGNQFDENSAGWGETNAIPAPAGNEYVIIAEWDINTYDITYVPYSLENPDDYELPEGEEDVEYGAHPAVLDADGEAFVPIEPDGWRFVAYVVFEGVLDDVLDDNETPEDPTDDVWSETGTEYKTREELLTYTVKGDTTVALKWLPYT
jgi:hypothetical protein